MLLLGKDIYLIVESSVYLIDALPIAVYYSAMLFFPTSLGFHISK